MPPRKNGGPKYPWREMKVGEMFFVPDGEERALTESRVHAATSKRNQEHRETRFAVRHFVKAGVSGFGVWRVS